LTTFTQTSKPHYPVLDGLRGIAALMVVIFHVFEAFITTRYDQIMNHGYLAVDFFFLLSGFVIGYAYDDRWSSMSVKEFFKIRLVRLQPMVIIGMIVGAICFYFQSSAFFPLIAPTPIWQVILIMLIGFTMIPVPPSMDIRGWAEMYPLNGPGWSLFFEYLVNILYALFVRNFSTLMLAFLVVVSAGLLIDLTVFGAAGDVIGGWALDGPQIYIGFVRVLFPFFGGLLLYRTGRLAHITNAFLWCSAAVIIIFSVPRIGDSNTNWMNGLYESFAIIVLFPLIIFMGASGELKSSLSKRICKFFGDISYPIYITHYPLIYIFTAWVKDNQITLQEGWLWGLIVVISSITLAYTSFLFYDIPVRSWLKSRLLLIRQASS
jgi:peptidoglycan/LPS O-acetylase OafA/YrhL